jgi:hypothetical protein
MRFICLFALFAILPATAAWPECRCFTRTPLDLVLILDVTDSMGNKISLVQGEMAEIVKVLQNNVAELRVGQVSYGESLEAHGFTSDPKVIKERLDRLRVLGNFEPVDLALQKALAMDWSPAARKVIIIIGDEPPDNHDNVTATEKSYELAAEARERGIIVHTVSALDPRTPLPEFVEIAKRGGGEALVLPQITELGPAIARLCLGKPVNWEEDRDLPPQEYAGPVHGPLLIQKLDSGGNWNLDPDDLTRLLIASAQDLGRQYSWATIHPNAEVEEYEKGQIVYLSSHGKLGLTDETWARLHDFVARGGFILADDCCNDPEFDQSFRDEMAKLFPDHPLAKLPPGNAIYHGAHEIAPDDQVLLGIEYECRTAVIYCPVDLSCRWAKGARRGLVKIDEGTAFALGENILQHIVRYNRLVSGAPKPITEGGKLGRKLVAVAQVIFEGDWDPPTQTLESVLSSLSKSGSTRVFAQRHAVRLTDESLYDYPVLFLTGHGEISLTDAEAARLKDYLDLGGVLFANACCGDRQFDASFRSLIKQIGLGAPLARIPADQNVFNIPNKIGKVKLTRSAERQDTAEGELLLEGVNLKDHWAVIYSPRDATAGLIENPCSLCDGYDAKDSQRIVTNILMYGLTK